MKIALLVILTIIVIGLLSRVFPNLAGQDGLVIIGLVCFLLIPVLALMFPEKIL